MRVQVYIRVLSTLAVLAMVTFAQQPFIFLDTTWAAGKLHPCTGEPVMVHEVQTENFAAQATMTYSLTILGVSKEWTDYNKYISERSDFIHGAIGLAGLACGSGGSTSLPATAAVSTFQRNVFTNTAKPRLSAPSSTQTSTSGATGARTTQPVPSTTGGQGIDQAETPPPPESSTESGKAVELAVVKKESGTKLTLPPNNITTDVEWCTFKQLSASGNNFSLRAGYNRTLSNEKITLGGTAVFNTMIMMDKLFFNNAINLSGSYLLTESSALERKIGGSINTFIVDKEFYGTPFGLSAVISFSDNWFVNQDNIVTYGGMVQQSMVGDVKTTLITAGMLFGLPIMDRYALNPSCVLAYNVLTLGKDGAVDVESPFMLQPAINGSIYFTRLFTLDLGAKTTLFLKDYSDFIVTLGTTVLF
jgi:hypothetical protein